VLYEPQEWVGDLGVVQVPCLHRHGAHVKAQILVRHFLRDALLERLARRSRAIPQQAGGFAVGRVHGGTDPGDGRQAAHLRQRRHQPT
jgi:hypothetical protein